jgi:hypothetical protein
MQRVITLSAHGHRTVSLSSYTQSWQRVKSLVSSGQSSTIFSQSLTRWWSCTARDILDEFREGMQDRINQAIPYILRGNYCQPLPCTDYLRRQSYRKWDSQWQTEAMRTAQEVNRKGIVRWVPMEFRERLSHRIETGD